MENILILIGDDLKINRDFLLDIFKRYIDKFGFIDRFKFISKNDPKLPEILEQLSKEQLFITIFTSSSSYYVVAKILATLTKDELELKDEQTLSLSRATKVCKNSFLTSLNSSYINLLKSDPLCDFPTIFYEKEPSFKDFYLFGYEIGEAKEELGKLAQRYNATINTIPYSRYLLLVRVERGEYLQLDSFLKECKEVFKNRVIFEKSIEELVVKKLAKNEAKITFAESCTAGLCAATICNIAGSSEVFDGSLVTYSNQIKHIWLNVEEKVLKTYGAVSKECVEQMLDGAIKGSGASFAIAISGIAGPGGATKDKPVGTVYIGVMQNGGKKIVQRFLIKGDRQSVRKESVNIAFSLLLVLREDLFLD